MTEWTHLDVSEDDQGIVTVRLNRPEARNAMNPAMMRALADVARAYRTRPSVRAVILTGAADYFSAGADLAASGPDGARAALSLLERREAVLAGPDMCRAWEEIEAVTIAAIEGYCVGGGCALAMACDFRIMGDSGRMRLPEVPLGINMSWRSLPRIAAAAGPSRAKRFVLFGEFAGAQRCLDWGLADELVAAGGALEEARRWAGRIAALPPLPVRMTKEAINAAVNAAHYTASYMDRDQFLLTSASADFAEGVAAFFEKRPARFKGD